MPKPFFLILFIFSFAVLQAQTSRLPGDTSAIRTGNSQAVLAGSNATDSVVKPVPVIKLTWRQDTAFTRFFINRTAGGQKPVFAINVVRQTTHNDLQFYILAALLLLVGITRTAFPKYYVNLFRSFFQFSYRQKQSGDTISQDALPSLLLNIVFILSGGLLLIAIARGNDLFTNVPFLLLWLYACGALTVIYVVKSLFIALCGWSFNVQEPAANYRFIVFLTNKVAGLCFIPLLLLITYASGPAFTTLMTVSVTFVIILLIYRYILSLSVTGKNLKINPLHFFLYLCAVEILPLLVVYKLLFVTTVNQFLN